MPKGRPAKKQLETFEGKDTAIAFKEKYFPTIPGFKPVPSLFPGYFGIALKNKIVYFRETPIAHNIVTGVVGADESFDTVTTSVFSAKLDDDTLMLLMSLRWGDAYYSVWLPYTESNSKRMKQLAFEIIQGVTENVLAFNHISRMNVKVILKLISDRLPHADIKTGGMMTTELIEYTGELNSVHKDIDRFLRPGLSLIGEVPPLKSKEQMARDMEEERLFLAKYTLEERQAIATKRVQEQSKRGGDIVYRNLLGATQAELLAMPRAEMEAFIANHMKQREEKEAKVREEVRKLRQEMLEQQNKTPTASVEVKKVQKTKSRTRKTQKQKETE